ncbi:MAG: DUF1295 domain-containing protein [Gammaproteobacteria bacterium]|nr:DUF1295 domain-containing protein [Gammaproteobacteria bacterium]
MLAQMIWLDLAALLGGFTLLWLLSLRLDDVSIVDRVWGLGFVLLALLGLVVRLTESSALPPVADTGSGVLTVEVVGWSAHAPAILLALMVCVWGVRLSLHIHVRNRGHGEDPRYARMRQKRPDIFPYLSLLTVFWLQAVLVLIIGAPIVSTMAAPLTGQAWPSVAGLMLAVAGIALFAIGLFFEAVGDWQLARFRRDPANRGKVLREGLWARTRHPNYFGDALVWWGLFLFALSASAQPWTIVSPLLMTLFLRYVSGVSLLERSLRSSRPGYASYVEEVPAFFPRLCPGRRSPP